jgi:hypothetical protein
MADTTDRVAARELIERIVRDSHLASDRERDALRRELADHFEDAAAAGASVGGDALARFGDSDDIADGFRRAYRRGWHTMYAAKVLAAAVAATLVALAIQLPLHLDVSAKTIAVTPLYLLAVRVTIFAVLAAVAAWELDVDWLCTRLERDPVRLIVACLALFTVLSAVHAYRGMQVTTLRALVGATTMVVVWASSLAILSRSDRVFLHLIGGDT